MALAAAPVTPRLSSRAIILIALGANLLIAACKFGVAAWTGSSAMFSEGVHSVADMGNELLLLYGLHRGAARPDADHPLGTGREVYFWSFAVALLVFALGALVSLHEGITRVAHPEPVRNAGAIYLVLALSAVIDGTSWWLTLRAFGGGRGFADLVPAIRRSKDAPAFIVLFEDSAAMVGLLIAFVGVYLSLALDRPSLDGMASICIGLMLAATAMLLARETKSLLIGERADQAIVDSIVGIAQGIDGVAHANGVLTVHLAPRQIVVATSLEFADELRTAQIEARVADLEQQVRTRHPEVVAIFVKPQSPEGYRETLDRRYGRAGDATPGGTKPA